MSDETPRHDPIQGEILHEYDGILEADNRLPRWWLVTFFGAIVFGGLYWGYYEMWRFGPNARANYSAEMQARLDRGGEITEDALLAMAGDGSMVEAGRTTFVTNCAACHGQQGEGNIGPNLTDDAWIHGATAVDIHHTIEAGVAARGMPQWGPVLGPNGVRQVAAYLISIRGTNVPGRAPEGEVASAAQ